MKGPDAANKLPGVTPHTKCRLRLLKMERIKDYLLMEEEFIRYVVHFNLSFATTGKNYPYIHAGIRNA